MQLSLNAVWMQAIGLVQRNWKLLAIIGGVFFFMPSLLMVMAMPGIVAVGAPGGNVASMEAFLENQLPLFFGVMLIIMLAFWVGTVAMAFLMGPERPTVGEAMRRGFAALPTMVGVALVFVLGYLVLGILFALIFGTLGAGLGMGGGSMSTGGAVGLGFFFIIGALVFALWLFARFCLITPVVAIEKVGNPFRAYGRAWRLTAPAQGRIMGFFLLLFVAYFVLSFVISLPLSVIVVAMPGTVGVVTYGIISGVLGLFVSMLFVAILVALHEALAGPSAAAIGETFE